MKVYLRGEGPARQAEHMMNICPANDAYEGEMPASWFDKKSGNPLEMNIIFKYGVAEVADEIGKYLISNGYAAKTRLIIRDPVIA